MLTSQNSGKTITMPPTMSSATRASGRSAVASGASCAHSLGPSQEPELDDRQDDDDQEQVDGLGRGIAHVEEPEAVLEDVVDEHPDELARGALDVRREHVDLGEHVVRRDRRDDDDEQRDRREQWQRDVRNCCQAPAPSTAAASW